MHVLRGKACELAPNMGHLSALGKKALLDFLVWFRKNARAINWSDTF